MKRFLRKPAPIEIVDDFGQPAYEATKFSPPNEKGERVPISFEPVVYDFRRTISHLRVHSCMDARPANKAVTDVDIAVLMTQIRMCEEDGIIEVDDVLLEALIEASRSTSKILPKFVSDQLASHYVALCDTTATDPRKAAA